MSFCKQPSLGSRWKGFLSPEKGFLIFKLPANPVNQELIGAMSLLRLTEKSKLKHLQLTPRLIEPIFPTPEISEVSFPARLKIWLFIAEIALLMPPEIAPVALSITPFSWLIRLKSMSHLQRAF